VSQPPVLGLQLPDTFRGQFDPVPVWRAGGSVA
jgi:hypothetical protein